MKKVLKVVLYFVLYLVFAYLAMLPGYASPLYWILFPIVASFLMAVPLTCTIDLIRKPGAVLVLPVLFFLLARLSGEMKFAVCWIPYLCVVILAEILWDLKVLNIRFAVPVTLLCMAMWNNGFYFGGEAYRAAGIADMGESYIAAAYRFSTPVTYIAVFAGVILAAYLGERLSEKIAKIS